MNRQKDLDQKRANNVKGDIFEQKLQSKGDHNDNQALFHFEKETGSYSKKILKDAYQHLVTEENKTKEAVARMIHDDALSKVFWPQGKEQEIPESQKCLQSKEYNTCQKGYEGCILVYGLRLKVLWFLLFLFLGFVLAILFQKVT